jgi:hypothetical protein
MTNSSSCRGFRGSLILLVAAASGCVGTAPFFSPPPEPTICQVEMCWEGRVQVTQDVVNGGRALPGLVGRVYLFGKEFKFPEKGNGSMAVDLYDASDAQGKAKHLERWELDPVTLNKLYRKDKIGFGYTLFLPWPTYRPEIRRVQLTLCYTPAKGSNPLYASPALVNLHNETPVVTVTHTRQIAPAN